MTDERTKRRIIRVVNCGVGSIKKIKDSLQLSESQTKIRNILKNTGTFGYAKIKKKPRLGPSHIKARLEFAKKSLQNRFDWREIIWSHQKKFNLDVPEGLSYYWHNLRRQEKILSRRVQIGFYKSKNKFKSLCGHP